LDKRPSINHGLRKGFIESANATLPLRNKGRRLAVGRLDLFKEESFTALRSIRLDNE
jgi:hypothetical protein